MSVTDGSWGSSQVHGVRINQVQVGNVLMRLSGSFLGVMVNCIRKVEYAKRVEKGVDLGKALH